MTSVREQAAVHAGTYLVLVFVALLVLLAAQPVFAIKRGTESVNCGGAASQSASFKAHDTIAQCPIGIVAEGGGMRAHDGFWLTLPSINVPVEATLYAVLSETGTPRLRWLVPSLSGITGFRVYRSESEEGPYTPLHDELLPPVSPGSFEDLTTWPQTTFWYEVRAVFAGGSEDALLGSPTSVTTGGTLALRFFPARPNPMTDTATFALDIPAHSGPVRLVLYNVRGQRVRTILDGPADRGRQTHTWDGTDDSGRPVASGVYLARLDVDGRYEDQKLMILR